ncbi:ABC-type phosphate/phosphonate transport system, substrate-binding protein [Rhodoferax sp. OV413]|uniref:phosphate/phosphite/phosphonate ABC transporter substrate-binding protein n=1 Tax=Rhodoferax sp. OV413 TaxID=1855285 RepID=UPI000888B5C8|nr:PhnD/SsuA/transferrin family substrate-binding protein [Rhodoferax sp. OV413]SDO26710.1 ABC-type phosphate/phosphonate transport system, substrate-binding protein [Rhodoferax sp. OV413]
MLSSLPMYAAGSAANATLWQAVAEQLRHAGLAQVPDTLAQPDDLMAHWTDPGLLLSQTCGYPLTHALAGRVQLVGAFAYAAPGCEGVYYRSQLVCRDADAGQPLEAFRGRVVAYNSEDSQSGYNSLRALLAPWARDGRFFASAVASGSHRSSVELVRSGQADLAAVDCVTWALLARDQPEAVRGLQVCGQTAPAPGLPLVTSIHTSAAVLQALHQALHQVVADPRWAEVRAALLVQDFAELPLSAYGVIPQMAQNAMDAGYPRL